MRATVRTNLTIQAGEDYELEIEAVVKRTTTPFPFELWTATGQLRASYAPDAPVLAEFSFDYASGLLTCKLTEAQTVALQTASIESGVWDVEIRHNTVANAARVIRRGSFRVLPNVTRAA